MSRLTATADVIVRCQPERPTLDEMRNAPGGLAVLGVWHDATCDHCGTPIVWREEAIRDLIDAGHIVALACPPCHSLLIHPSQQGETSW